MKYYKLYFQKSKSGQRVIETIEAWGLYCMDISLNSSYSVKDVSKNEWKDQDGDDEYIPDVLRLNSYETTIKLGYKGQRGTANGVIKSLLDYLTGNEGTGGGAEMKFYCDYTCEGRQNVRFVKIDDKAELVRDDDGDILVISITLKVNDPWTDITCKKDEKGNIVSLVTA